MLSEVSAAATFRLLFVCTGNLCRSPFAEILTRGMLQDRLGTGAAVFEVASAGVDAVVGAPMHPASREALAPWGLAQEAAESFRARQLDASMLAGANLVLGATPWHRAVIVQLWPRALPVTFSVLEFARLVAVVDASALPVEPLTRARVLVPAARARRGIVPPPAPDSDALPDPISGGSQAHLNSARLCAEALNGIVAAVAPCGELASRAGVRFDTC